MTSKKRLGSPPGYAGWVGAGCLEMRIPVDRQAVAGLAFGWSRNSATAGMTALDELQVGSA